MVITFAYIDTSTTLTVNSISLIPNAIPSRPAPESFDEVLRKCQYYYETSYDLGVFPGTGSTNGVIIVEQQPAGGATGQFACFPLFFSVRYVVHKRIGVTPSIYAQDGTAANVLILLYQGDTVLINIDVVISGNWTLVDSGQTGFAFEPVNRNTAVASIGSGVGGNTQNDLATQEYVQAFQHIDGGSARAVYSADLINVDGGGA
jgi:hypothetical protein